MLTFCKSCEDEICDGQNTGQGASCLSALSCTFALEFHTFTNRPFLLFIYVLNEIVQKLVDSWGGMVFFRYLPPRLICPCLS